MADNVELNAGSGGATCSTDDCGAAGHCQRVKLAVSADGSATHITADAKGLLVQQTTAADFNCTEASASAIKTAVEKLDDCISGSEAQVDVVAALPAGTNLLGKVSIDQVTANANEVVVKSGTVTAVTSITNAVAVTNAGITTIAGAVSGTEMQCDIVASIPAGTNLIGDVSLGLRASGGATPYSYISDGTDFVSVTDGATTLYALSCTSTDATVVYIKVYDKATAPDPSADAASIKLRFAVPSAATGGGFVWSIPQGMDFPTGLGFALVTGAADTDETAVTANEVMVNMVYKH